MVKPEYGRSIEIHKQTQCKLHEPGTPLRLDEHNNGLGDLQAYLDGMHTKMHAILKKAKLGTR
jgi:hypothetical protein